MTIQFDLSPETEAALKAEGVDPQAFAKEALLIAMYRWDHLSHGQLASALGISRYEADGVLKRHNVTEDLPTLEELREDAKMLSELLDKKKVNNK